MFLSLALRILSIPLLGIAAFQDRRERRVSNWITLPLFIAGVGNMIYTANVYALVISVILYLVWRKRWLGGADAKVLIGLWGISPLAASVSMVATAVYGATRLFKEDKSFPGMVPIAAGAILTFLFDIATMLLNRGVLP